MDRSTCRTSERTAILHRRGVRLESMTLAWNVVGVVVLGVAAIRASSVALAGFGLDSLIEIGASTVVLWELSGTGMARQRRALRLIGAAFLALAGYLLVQSVIALVIGHRAEPSWAGMAWTAVTAVVMFALAAGKTRTGRELGNPVLATEGRVTFIDGTSRDRGARRCRGGRRPGLVVGRPSSWAGHRLLRRGRGPAGLYR